MDFLCVQFQFTTKQFYIFIKYKTKSNAVETGQSHISTAFVDKIIYLIFYQTKRIKFVLHQPQSDLKKRHFLVTIPLHHNDRGIL